MRNGFILLHRKGITHEEWKHPRRTLAWIDLLTLADYETGIVVASYGYLADRWRVSKHTAFDWMQHFIGERQLERKGERDRERNGERWFVVNYAKYQNTEERDGERGRERKGERRREPKKKVIGSTSLESNDQYRGKPPPARPIPNNLIPLAVFTLAKGIRFDNHEQLRGHVSRFVRESTALQGYSPEQVLRAFLFACEEAGDRYDVQLETVGKKIAVHKDWEVPPKLATVYERTLKEFAETKDALFTQSSPLLCSPN